MAYRKYSRSNNFTKKKRNFNRKKKRTSFATHRKDVTSLAFKMGCVQRGLNNPDSQISACYNAGLERTPREKKSLY